MNLHFEERHAQHGYRIGIASLDAEKSLNALSLPMIEALAGKLAAWADDPSIACVLLRGNGPKAFCAGGDVLQLVQACREQPGQIPELARRFAQVTALDNSPTMLELARQVCQREGLDNVNLQLADALNATDVAADCVVLNMVLHHFSDPALALRQLAKRVKAGGSLLVTELCSHDQGWARDACGDLWLGFEQDDLARWANSAGLVPGDSLYVGLRNGFQIQVRHFQRATGDIHHR